MFKILAGVFLVAVGVFAYREGSSGADFYIVPGIALIAAGLDAIFYKK